MRNAVVLVFGLVVLNVATANGQGTSLGLSSRTAQMLQTDPARHDATAALMRMRSLTPGERGALIGGVLGFAAGFCVFGALSTSEGAHFNVGDAFLGGLGMSIPFTVLGAFIGGAAGGK